MGIQHLSFLEVFDAIKSLMIQDVSYWRIVEVVEKPVGKKQGCDSDLFDHEYVYQRANYDDDYYGSIYLPIGDGRYIQVEYNG